MEKIKVLLAEDEIALATILKESLESRGFDVTHVENGAKALVEYQNRVFDVLVFDVMMPEKDGFKVTQEIRQQDTKTPIIMLTAKSQTADVVFGFKNGANDYIKKPFSIEELIVRIESLLGRNKNKATSKTKIGSFEFDFNKQTLVSESEFYNLTFMEAQLLLMLVENKNDIVDRTLILNEIWGSDTYFNGRSLDVFITKLRKKLFSDQNVKIINSRNKGYKIVLDEIMDKGN